MLLCLLLLMFMSSDQILVLKNNKKILCESYENENGRVTVVRQGQTFSLPASAIDWDASARATEQLAAQRAIEAEAKKLAEAEDNRLQYRIKEGHKPKGKISLTNREYHEARAARGEVVGPVDIDLRRHNNSLLIDVMINDRGPYTLVLDTGASTTTVSPNLAAEAGLRPTGEQAMVAGVGGMSVAEVAIMDTVSVNGARVDDLQVTIHNIPILASINAHGLLGQDYLNHFSMTLEGDRLTLAPSASGSAKAAAAKSGNSEDGVAVGERLGRVFQWARRLSEEYQATNPLENGNQKAKECQQLQVEAKEAQAAFNRFFNGLVDDLPSQMSESDRNTKARMDDCLATSRQMLQTMNRYIADLRWSYRNVDTMAEVNRERARIIEDFGQLSQEFNDMLRCMRSFD